MSAKLKPFYTLEEYFQLVKTSEEKYEYWNGQIFLMSGGKKSHAFISDNLLKILSNQLNNKCRVFSSGMAIKVPLAPPFRYADLSVACNSLIFEEISGIDVLVNPIVIIEVLSPSTERYDKGAKFTLYQSIESFREYLLVEQSSASIIHYVKSDDNTWQSSQINGLESSIYLSSIDCTLALSEIYQDIILN